MSPCARFGSLQLVWSVRVTLALTSLLLLALCCVIAVHTVSGLMHTKSPAAAGHGSPNGSSLGKRGRQGTNKKAPAQAPQPAGYASGVPIRPDTISDSCSERKVLVYWPADHQWWEATLCRVSLPWLFVGKSGVAMRLKLWSSPCLHLC